MSAYDFTFMSYLFNLQINFLHNLLMNKSPAIVLENKKKIYIVDAVIMLILYISSESTTLYKQKSMKTNELS